MQAGDLKTKIRIQKSYQVGTGSFSTTHWADLGNTLDTDPPRYIWASWLPLGAAETWIANSEQDIDAANVTIRYRTDVNSKCQLIKDGVIYQIITPNDPDQRRMWLKFKTKAAVTGG